MLTDMENKFYYIYEIWGKKIGCAENLERRMREQNVFDGRYDILEVHTDIMLASKRELELQKKYGYPVDKIPYYVMCNNVKTSRDKIDWVAAKAKVENWGELFRTKRTPKIDYKAVFEKRDNKDIQSKRIPKIEKPVAQYNLNGVFIQQFKSAKDAGFSLGKLKTDDIGAVCRGKQKTAFGYIWKFTN
jgi:hypothetical protein